MGLGYSIQNQPLVLIGSKSGTTRTGVALTDAYDVANKTKIIETGEMSKANFSFLYTVGASETDNSLLIRFETSSDGTNFYRIPNEAVSAGASVLTQREFSFVGATAAAHAFSLPLDIQDKFLRISVKESGVASNVGTIFCEVQLSGSAE